MKIIVTEEQINLIINNIYSDILFEQTKPAPKNQTYTTTQDRLLTKDTLLGGELKIPKGTRFTAHQTDVGPTARYWVSVDRMVNVGKFDAYAKVPQKQKLTYSTIFWCNSTNAGKFWNEPSKSWYYDKTKILSGYLSKNLCTKSYGDKWREENSGDWEEQKKLKKEDAWAAENSPYVDATGKKVMYYKSTEFKKNYDFLKSNGLVVDGVPNPQSAVQQFNLCALFSIKFLTDYQLSRLGWRNTECLQIGLESLGSVKMVSKKLKSYDLSIKSSLNNKEHPIWTDITVKVNPLYANFVLSDFYFQWGKLVNDINASPTSNNTVYFPDGVYNFMSAFYGTTNAAQLKSTYDKVRPSCVNSGLSTEQQHNVIEGLQIASMFVPFIGPFLAAGLGVVDSAIYFSEGKKWEAGLVLGLSLIPFAAEIPALKTVSKAVFESIALKTVKKLPFNVEELNVIKILNANKAEVKVATDKWIAKQSSNKTVQEFIKIVKNKGEDAIKGEIEKTTGIKFKYIPSSNADIVKKASSEVKSQVKTLATNAAKSADTPTPSKV